MNTLTNIEAERVVQAVRHSIDQLQVVSHVPPSPDFDSLTRVGSAHVREALRQQWVLEDQLEQVSEAMQDSMAELGGVDIAITRQLCSNTKLTCRLLQTDRESLQQVMSMPQSSHSSEFTQLIRYLIELRSYLHSKLTTTVEDEASNRNILHELTERERQMEETRDALEHQLRELREERERVTSGMDKIIRKLQLEQQDLAQSRKQETDAIARETTDKIEHATADHEAREKSMLDKVDALNRQLWDSSQQNQETEKSLRKQKHKVEDALSNKIQAYDEAMTSTETELNTIHEQLRVETEEYRILKAHFDKIDANTTRSRDETRRLRAVDLRDRKRALWLHGRAKVIQRWLRGKVASIMAKKAAEAKKAKKAAKKK